ncbi:universal stress protein [Streptomyces sp. NBC_01190]|uniref:universal stress protein n=1 Tax=Streptomyces sp. NBC_01190 TaxID=2903767 RepID=UPI00386E8D86|nr:universal stress protein [Streptomyces sp. NBC_01190]
MSAPAPEPSGESAGGPGRIVVGVDGSEPSLQALRWAARQAALSGSTVEAVLAWELPGALGWSDLPELPEHLDLEEPARSALAKAVAAALPGEQAVPVTELVVIGNPTHALLDRSKDAELLVVGARGHGTFRDTLLGSVSHTVTLHASCPVVVVRDDTTGLGSGGATRAD